MRDLTKLNEIEYDLAIIGGGINGAAIAWEAILRGYKVALIEKDDFGSQTTSACFKTIHGGLRYLQHFDIRRLRESVLEQRVWRKIAPHLVVPLPFIVPCYGSGMRGKAILDFAMSAYELLAFDRNIGVSPEQYLKRHSALSPEEILGIAPGLNTQGLRGGMIYYDCQILNTERLAFLFVKAAAKRGALVCNYAEVTELRTVEIKHSRRKIVGLNVRDVVSGNEFLIRAKEVVNATGPWSSALVSKLDCSQVQPEKKEYFFSKGLQVVVPKIIDKFALAIESKFSDRDAKLSRGGRSFFIIPWKDRSLVGTTSTAYSKNPDEFSISENEVKTFLEDIKSNYRGVDTTLDNVLWVFGGLQPVADGAKIDENGEVQISRTDEVLDHREEIVANSPVIENLTSVIGVKYTTSRRLAEKILNLIDSKLSRISSNRGESANICLPGGGSFDSDLFDLLPKELATRFLGNYGSIAQDFLADCNYNALKIDLLAIQKAEVRYLIREEFVIKLSDLVLRRSGISALGYPGDEIAYSIAQIMAEELSWDKSRIEEEVQELRSRFGIAGLARSYRKQK